MKINVMTCSKIPIYGAVSTDTVGTGLPDGPLENETFSRSPTAIRRYCGINCLAAIVIFQQKITGPSGRPVPTAFNNNQFDKSEL